MSWSIFAAAANSWEPTFSIVSVWVSKPMSPHPLLEPQRKGGLNTNIQMLWKASDVLTNFKLASLYYKVENVCWRFMLHGWYWSTRIEVPSDATFYLGGLSFLLKMVTVKSHWASPGYPVFTEERNCPGDQAQDLFTWCMPLALPYPWISGCALKM